MSEQKIICQHVFEETPFTTIMINDDEGWWGEPDKKWFISTNINGNKILTDLGVLHHAELPIEKARPLKFSTRELAVNTTISVLKGEYGAIFDGNHLKIA